MMVNVLNTNFHWFVVDLDTIELFCRLSSAGGAAEHNGSNTTALSIWSVGQEDPFDRSDSLSKVVLK